MKIAINGFGRIGRMLCRALYESPYKNKLELVAINDLVDGATCAHLLKYDSVHGQFAKTVENANDALIIDGEKVKLCKEPNPANLPWGDLGVDLVLECSGRFATRDTAALHLDAGAGRVMVSAPAENADLTVVYGVNHDAIGDEHKVISNASCTTNCLAPLAKVLNDTVGIVKGYMTTVHSYTGDQPTVDTAHKDLRRARAAAINIIPTSTGAAKAIGLVIPELKGKLDGCAVRVPTPNVSMVDLTFMAGKPTSVEEINQSVKQAADGDLKGVLEYNEAPLVSSDMNHNPHSSIFDSTQTQIVQGDFVRVLSWYDNEWGFSNRMVEVAAYLSSK
ncbi:MAG: type I glyceraldehyde-3-phosphate dehydrogenase [Candidatus Portiera sp.]|nr:type I glyceraldehyde-3-phosphate dehydrogenase [Portiera sp.]